MKRALLAAVLLAVCRGPAFAGHEVTFYPTFYTDEIRIDTLLPFAAAGLLKSKVLHAYIGGDGRAFPDA